MATKLNMFILSIKNKECPICKKKIENNLGEHIRKIHGDEAFRKIVIKAKKNGMSDPEIGEVFGITFRQLEKIITKEYGINISNFNKIKKIKYWVPKNFEEEKTSVWSFKQRGNWATHTGKYRGNWSPYIPRNIILKYSKLGDVVLDYFVGGGTTAIEAKLLGRRCIARDINPSAVELTKENLNFIPPPSLIENYKIYEPEVSVGDARDLSDIPDESIDLICAHPPYAGIINYSSQVEGDLSKLSVENFLKELSKVAKESYRVLKPGGKCAILIEDTRKKKHVVPIGFRTIRVFLDAGFNLRELVIKRQHNCKTTGFWYERSIKYNFLLLAHEYLPIFEKPIEKNHVDESVIKDSTPWYKLEVSKIEKTEKKKIETTTVWIFPPERMEEEIKRNLIERFGTRDAQFIEVKLNTSKGKTEALKENTHSLVYINYPKDLSQYSDILSYIKRVKEVAQKMNKFLSNGSFIVIDAKDVRINGLVYPVGVNLLEEIGSVNDLDIKEIVVVTSDGKQKFKGLDEKYLEIIHRYLLIFIKGKEGR